MDEVEADELAVKQREILARGKAKGGVARHYSLAGRVKRAARLWVAGATKIEIARMLGVARRTIHVWATKPEWAEVVGQRQNQLEHDLQIRSSKLAKLAIEKQRAFLEHAGRRIDDAELRPFDESELKEMEIAMKTSEKAIERIMPGPTQAAPVQVTVQQQQAQGIQQVSSISDLDKALGLDE